jgi:hypothetical protein
MISHWKVAAAIVLSLAATACSPSSPSPKPIPRQRIGVSPTGAVIVDTLEHDSASYVLFKSYQNWSMTWKVRRSTEQGVFVDVPLRFSGSPESSLIPHSLISTKAGVVIVGTVGTSSGLQAATARLPQQGRGPLTVKPFGPEGIDAIHETNGLVTDLVVDNELLLVASFDDANTWQEVANSTVPDHSGSRASAHTGVGVVTVRSSRDGIRSAVHRSVAGAVTQTPISTSAIPAQSKVLQVVSGANSALLLVDAPSREAIFVLNSDLTAWEPWSVSIDTSLNGSRLHQLAIGPTGWFGLASFADREQPSSNEKPITVISSIDGHSWTRVRTHLDVSNPKPWTLSIDTAFGRPLVRRRGSAELITTDQKPNGPSDFGPTPLLATGIGYFRSGDGWTSVSRTTVDVDSPGAHEQTQLFRGKDLEQPFRVFDNFEMVPALQQLVGFNDRNFPRVVLATAFHTAGTDDWALNESPLLDLNNGTASGASIDGNNVHMLFLDATRTATLYEVPPDGSPWIQRATHQLFDRRSRAQLCGFTEHGAIVEATPGESVIRVTRYDNGALQTSSTVHALGTGQEQAVDSIECGISFDEVGKRTNFITITSLSGSTSTEFSFSVTPSRVERITQVPPFHCQWISQDRETIACVDTTDLPAVPRLRVISNGLPSEWSAVDIGPSLLHRTLTIVDVNESTVTLGIVENGIPELLSVPRPNAATK